MHHVCDNERKEARCEIFMLVPQRSFVYCLSQKLTKAL